MVEFYDSDQELVESVAAYVRSGLAVGEAAIVVATEAHRAALQATLSAVEVTFLDAGETLASFLVDGVLDQDAFERVVGELVTTAAAGGRPVRIFGEMVALLWERGLVPAAIELETYWNDLARQIPFSLFCAYPSAASSAEICSLHSDVFGRPVGHVHDQAAVEAVRAFAATPTAPRAARQFVRETLREWRLDRLVDDAQLIASELTTNSVIHAHSNFTVTIAATEDVVRIAVTDSNPALPKPRESPVQATGGRGMQIVTALAARWSAESRPHGKIVWAELSMTST